MLAHLRPSGSRATTGSTEECLLHECAHGLLTTYKATQIRYVLQVTAVIPHNQCEIAVTETAQADR